MFYYRVDPESAYYKAYMKAGSDMKKFKTVYQSVCTDLGLKPLDDMSVSPTQFWYEYDKLPNEMKKLFKQDGHPKKNIKAGREINELHKHYVEENNLTNYESPGIVNFTYGVMRRSESQNLKFLFGLDTMYIEASWDFTKTYEGWSTEDFSFLKQISEMDFVNAHKAVLEANAS